jgi:hypothetical protein
MQSTIKHVQGHSVGRLQSVTAKHVSL